MTWNGKSSKQRWDSRTGHEEGSHDVIAAGHCSFDQCGETATILYFSVYARVVVQQVRDCVDMTCK